MDRLIRHQQDRLDDDEGHSKRRKRKWFSTLIWKWRSFSKKDRSIVIGSLIVILAIFYFLQRKVLGLWVKRGPNPKQTLDFVVAGFPKSGTTSLLFALEKHPQVLIDDKEYCEIARPLQQDDVNLNRLNKYIQTLKRDKKSTARLENEQKVGIKCPEALKNFKAIHRLSQHSPNSKWVVGLRHPISFIQSFYNYRVFESHIRPKKPDEIPSLHSLWENSSLVFRDLTKDSARYDLYLSQLGKTGLNMTQLQSFLDHDMLAVKPNRIKVFVYAMEQLEDDNTSRKRSFQNDLMRFLDLNPNLLLEDVGHANKNHATGQSGYPETINICSTEFSDIRLSLLDQGAAAARWIMDEFLLSPDVQVSNVEHFRESLEKWSNDPCHDGYVM